MLDTLLTYRAHPLVSHLFVFSYSSWCSQGKNAEDKLPISLLFSLFLLLLPLEFFINIYFSSIWRTIFLILFSIYLLSKNLLWVYSPKNICLLLGFCSFAFLFDLLADSCFALKGFFFASDLYMSWHYFLFSIDFYWMKIINLNVALLKTVFCFVFCCLTFLYLSI